jgi:hypothetical protein
MSFELSSFEIATLLIYFNFIKTNTKLGEKYVSEFVYDKPCISGG